MSNKIITLEDKEKNIHVQYLDIISPLIGVLEVEDQEYPVEILNEIRAMFTHLSRYKVDNKESELDSAENHVKRAILDCYKYLCIAHKEHFTRFRNSYRDVDFTYANNGAFLPGLDELENEADKLYKIAKTVDISKKKKMDDGSISSIEIDELYQLYEDAYNKHCEVKRYIEENNQAILHASMQSLHNKKVSNGLNLTSIIVTSVSIVVTVAVTIASAYGYTIKMLFDSLG